MFEATRNRLRELFHSDRLPQPPELPEVPQLFEADGRLTPSGKAMARAALAFGLGALVFGRTVWPLAALGALCAGAHLVGKLRESADEAADPELGEI